MLIVSVSNSLISTFAIGLAIWTGCIINARISFSVKSFNAQQTFLINVTLHLFSFTSYSLPKDGT